MKVYIEDTDAYGILYNANYLKFYDRALHRTSYENDCDNDDNHDNNDDVLQHEGWSIVGVQSVRYKQSPPLGGSFVVTGERVQNVEDGDSSVKMETWNLAMTSVDGATVYNTAEGLQIARPPSSHDAAESSTSGSWLPRTKPILRASNVSAASTAEQPTTTAASKSSSSFSSAWTDVFSTYRDEFDPHLTTHMPLTKLLNMWERARSNMLGGPDALRRLQHDDQTLLVVTSNQDLALMAPSPEDDTATSANHQLPLIRPGQSVTVETVAILKRRGTVVECHQSAFSSATGACLGQGVTTILAIDADTKRPVRSLPDWLLKRFQ